MLKDLLLTLNQSAEATKARRATGQESMASLVSAASAGVSGPPQGEGNKDFDAVSTTLDFAGAGGAKLKAFLQAISRQESGGNYQAKGVQTASGRAYGKYQILDSNFVGKGGWDKETLGRDITLEQYLNSPKLQERMAQGKLSSYFNKYGAAGAAKAWYAGEGNHNTNSNSPQYGGPSINAYAASVIKRMKEHL